MTQLEDAWVAEELRREGGGVAGELDVALENFDRGTELTSASRPLLERIADAAVSVRDNLQPQGDVPNDSTNTQRALNIATSLPIVLLGVRLRGKVKTNEGMSYANSVVAVGMAATLYHSSWGGVRRITRKLDYYAISYCSAKLVRALWPGETSKRAEHVMHCITPFRPFWVSSAGAAAMQVEFVRLAAKHRVATPGPQAPPLCWRGKWHGVCDRGRFGGKCRILGETHALFVAPGIDHHALDDW